MVEVSREEVEMRIGELARRSGVSAKAIRYYEDVGLLPASRREVSGYRTYNELDVERLDFVGKAKTLGFSLAEIGDVLRASETGTVNCDHVLALLRSRRDVIDIWIREAQVLRDALDRTIAYSSDRIDAERSSGHYHCPVVERGLHERALLADSSAS